MGKKYKLFSWLLIIILLFLSVLQQMVIMFPDLPAVIILSKYYIVSLLWGLFIMGILLLVPKVHTLGKIKNLGNIYFAALLFAIFIILSRNAAGFAIYGFGRNPYDLTPSGILKNIVNFIPLMIAREFVRSYAINTYCQRKNKIFFYLFSVLITFCDFNFIAIRTIVDTKTLIIFISKNIIPAVFQSILLSGIVLYGGAAAAVIFIITIFVFQWIIPVLPNLNWLCEGVLGIIVPSIELSLLQMKYKQVNYRIRFKQMSKKEMISTGITLSLSTLFLWFVVGVFPVYPSVIATGSMEPMIYPGDIVLIEKITDPKDFVKLKVGDVIHFDRDEIEITHRIIEVVKDKKGNLSFRTRGDNNSAEDSRLVKPEDIRGTLYMVVPKLGYPTLWLKERQKQDMEGITF